MLPLDDRSRRALQRRPRRPAGARSTARLAAALRRHGAPDARTASSTSRTSRTRSRPRSSCPAIGRRGRDHRPGRRVSAGWSLYAKDGQLKYCYNLLRPAALHGRGDDADPAGRRTRCAWSSPTTAAAWARAARSRSTSTGKRPGRASGSMSRCQILLFSFDRVSGRRRQRPGCAGESRLSRARERVRGRAELEYRSTSRKSSLDADHFISAEERVRVAHVATVTTAEAVTGAPCPGVLRHHASEIVRLTRGETQAGQRHQVMVISATPPSRHEQNRPVCSLVLGGPLYPDLAADSSGRRCAAVAASPA